MISLTNRTSMYEVGDVFSNTRGRRPAECLTVLDDVFGLDSYDDEDLDDDDYE